MSLFMLLWGVYYPFFNGFVFELGVLGVQDGL